MSLKIAALALVAAAGVANAGGITYLVSDDSTLYRGLIGGGPAEKFDFLSGEHLIGMTIVPTGAVVNGAAPGDVIAVDDQLNAGQSYNIYRVDNAFTGTPSLTVIGTSNRVSNTLAFRDTVNGWELYGANGLGQTFKVHELDLTTFAGSGDIDSGFAVLGIGGLQFNNGGAGEAFFTDNGSNAMYGYDIGVNSVTTLGPSGSTFTNQGLEYVDGTLYGGLGLNSGRISVGTWDTASGAYTELEDVAPYSGGVMGFVAVPTPGTLALIGLAGLATRRRR